jgi:DNA-binding MarR family transcriptional regulator
LTDAGAAAHADLLRMVSDNRERLTTGITPQEYAGTIEVLRRMAVNLGWAEPVPAPS